MTFFRDLLPVIAIVIPATMACAEDFPPCFSSTPYPEAVAAARESSKLLIVVGTATWCGPCKNMQRTAWREEDVVQWVKDNAVVVPMDIDKYKEDAGKLGISAIPTLIAYRRGTELSRVTGGRDGKALLEFLEAAKANPKGMPTDEELLNERFAARAKLPPRERIALARALTDAGRNAVATTEYVWLWQNLGKDPATARLRGTELPGDIRHLIDGYPEAGKPFVDLRDKLDAKATAAKPDRDALVEWASLNEVLGESDRTLAWYDKNKDNKSLEGDWRRIAGPLGAAFKSKNRWADLGRIIVDPQADYQSAYTAMQQAEPPAKPGGAKRPGPQDAPTELQRRFIEGVATNYAALLAAGRDKEAERLEARLIKQFDNNTARVLLVERALAAGQARPDQVKLLEDAAKKGADTSKLSEELKAALARK